jgi:hypothetical protein
MYCSPSLQYLLMVGGAPLKPAHFLPKCVELGAQLG